MATNNLGLFVQDAWTISNRLTVNLGLRTENETVAPFQPGLDLLTGLPAEGTVGMRAIKFGFTDKLAPRLGVAWDVAGDGRWKAYGSWGVFYDIFKMNLTRGGVRRRQVAGVLVHARHAGLDDAARSARHRRLPAGLPRLDGHAHRAARTTIGRRVPSIRTSSRCGRRKLSAGLEHQLSAATAVSVRYVRKWLDRAVDDTGSWSPDGEVYIIANPGFG